ncbi:MAG: DUF11 domain-containing protein, partial [Caldilineaceae bacterium]|nr:DUF11 domain-containing protein [Caldilineaceae bacterium]
DSGDGSLRQALLDICAGSTITFADDFTIYLDAYLTVGRSMTIDGSGVDLILSGDAGVLDDDSDNVSIMIIETQDPYDDQDLERPVTLNALTFADGYAQAEEDPMYDGVTAGFAGGALLVRGYENLTLSNSTFRNNQSVSQGGAIYGEGTMEIDNSTFVGNYAEWDGGAMTTYVADVTLRNSTMSNNTSGGDAAGYMAITSDVAIINSTIVSNTANLLEEALDESGAGLNHSGYRLSATIERSIIAGNRWYDGATYRWDDCDPNLGDGFSVTIDGGYNLFGADGGCPADADTTQEIEQTTLFTTVLAALDVVSATGSAGGIAYVHTPYNDSPAVDAAGSDCEATDQRGLSRPQGDACDIGAVEMAVAELSVTTSVTPTAVAAGDPITYTVTVTNEGSAAATDVVITLTLPSGV